MKNTFKYCLAVAIFLTSQNLFAQLYPVSLDQRIEKATAIVWGKVTAQKSYMDDKGDIYTANLVSVRQLLKGHSEETIVIITRGGQVEERHTEWSHTLWLAPNEEGIFFLSPSTIDPIKDPSYEFQHYSTYAGEQGFIKIAADAQTKAIVGNDPFDTYIDVYAQVVDQIKIRTGETPTTVGGGLPIRSGVRYRFANFTTNGNSVSFDIFVNSLIGSKKLKQSGIVLGYSPVVFGNNLGSNGNLQLTEAGISAQPPYNLFHPDLPNNKVALSMQTAGPTTTFSVITNTEQLLAKGSLTFLNPTADPQILVDIAQLYAMNQWFDTGSGQSLPFDTIIVEGDFFGPLVTPVITSFTPTTVSAGTKTVVEIKGMNFEDYTPYVSSVYFRNAQGGPTDMFTTLEGDIVSWSPTSIKVEVPTKGKAIPTSQILGSLYAGTGQIRVCNASGMCATSVDPLTVIFAIQNEHTLPGETPVESTFPLSLSAANDQNGFYISYGASFAADAAAVACAERALNTWKCATGLNYTTDPAHPNLYPENTAELSYASLGAGTLAVVGTTTVRCSDNATGDFVQGALLAFTFEVDNDGSTNWYKDLSESGIMGTGKVDMQSVLLHEFGHTHLLRHVNRSADVMFGSINAEQPKRKLQPNDIAGSNWVMAKSIVALPGTDCPDLTLPMSLADVTGIPCSTLVSLHDLAIEGTSVEVYPNPFDGMLNLQFGDTNEAISFSVDVVDLTGKVWWHSSASITGGGAQQIDLSSMPPGLYFLNIVSQNGQQKSTKIIKQ